MSHARRLNVLEAAENRRNYQKVAEEFGLTVEDLIEEAEEFFALSLGEQLARVDALEEDLRAEGMSTDDLADIKETLTRYYRP